MSGIVLIYDNVKPHTATHGNFLSPPSYSLDLHPFRGHSVLIIPKGWFYSQWLENSEELRMAVLTDISGSGFLGTGYKQGSSSIKKMLRLCRKIKLICKKYEVDIQYFLLSFFYG